MIGRPQWGWPGLEKWLLLGILVLQVPMWFGAGGWPSVWKLEAQVEAKKLEIAAQHSQIEELEAEVLDLRTGLESAEERARYEMGLMRPGERFVQIVRTP
ncbi:MAG: cell division protein FtsB [Pseudomonadota bacterium]